MTMERVLETCSVICHTHHNIFLKWYGSVRDTDPMKINFPVANKVQYHTMIAELTMQRPVQDFAMCCSPLWESHVLVNPRPVSYFSHSSAKMTQGKKKHAFTILGTCLNTGMLGANLFLKCFGHHFGGSRKGGNISCLFSSLPFFISIEIL